MREVVKARHMRVTQAIQSYVEQKLIQPARRLCDDPAATLEVQLDEPGHVKGLRSERCWVHLSMPAVNDIIIEEVDDDMYTAIDRAHDRLLQQIKRTRDRLHDGHSWRQQAARSRARTARLQLTLQPEPWEQEVAQYEAARVHG